MEGVSSQNVKKFQIEFSANDAGRDGLNAYITMIIMEAAAIKEILEGRVRAVSCGYAAEFYKGNGN